MDGSCVRGLGAEFWGFWRGDVLLVFKGLGIGMLILGSAFWVWRRAAPVGRVSTSVPVLDIPPVPGNVHCCNMRWPGSGSTAPT